MNKHLRIFLTGLIAVTPFLLTFYIIKSVIELTDSLFVGILPEKILRFTGVGFLISVVIIYLLGYLASNYVGSMLLSYIERIIKKMPLVGRIYTFTKDIVKNLQETLSTKAAFSKVVLVNDFPGKGNVTPAFVTGRQEIRIVNGEPRKYVAVYLPTTPVPTQGFLYLVDEKDIIEVEMTVEEAMVMLLSLGTASKQANNSGNAQQDKQ